MNTYKEVFCFYEETALHVGVPEVEKAESRFTEQLQKLGKLVNADILHELDQTYGVIARAYELQGFAFAQQVYDEKNGYVKINPEAAVAIRDANIPLEAATVAFKKPRRKQINAHSDSGQGVRIVESNGMKKTISEWVQFLDCGHGTIYDHLNRGNFDEWVARRIATMKRLAMATV